MVTEFNFYVLTNQDGGGIRRSTKALGYDKNSNKNDL